MRAQVEYPTIEKRDKDPLSDSIERHPAYAQIAASRVAGGSVSLYGSDFVHNHFITITIRKSELHRGLNRDWNFAREEYISVALSEAQWATFVSTPNSGMGTPCTLEHFKGEQIPTLPEPVARADQFRGEMAEMLEKTIQRLRDCYEHLDKLAPKSVSSKLKDAIQMAEREMVGSVPFVAKQFSEHVEHTVEAAKVEIEAYTTSAIHRAGLQALQEGKASPFRLGPAQEESPK